MRCSRRTQCHFDANGRETLGELIDTYVHKYRPGAEAELASFSSKTLEQAIEHAALAHDDEGRRFSHQRRLTSANLAQALSLLKADLAGIRRCTDFDELIGLVEAKVRAIKGLGELYSYDTALRIGAQKDVLPTHV